MTWSWEMYGFEIDVTAKELEQSKRIVIEFPAGSGSVVEWTFTARPDGTTYVRITNTGFEGDAETAIKAAIDSTEGFAYVLAGAKAWLEQGVRLNLVPDKYPDGMPA